VPAKVQLHSKLSQTLDDQPPTEPQQKSLPQNMTHQLPPEVRVLTEDDIYRTSSQFRVWSFSPESLAARRTKTHEIAIERIEKQRSTGANNAFGSDQNGRSIGEKLDYLTEYEELRLVQKYCDMIRVTNDNLSWPANVKVSERASRKLLPVFSHSQN
jgi:hypothetical protein